MMAGLDLELAAGWTEVEPRGDGPSLLVEENGCLAYLRSDFSQVHEYGAVGPVDCPIAYDPAQHTAYRYVCSARLGRADYSQIRAFDLRDGSMRPAQDLPLSHWVLWLLEWLPGAKAGTGHLFGLLASDDSTDDGVVIRHQLFAHVVGESCLRMRPLCRDAYYPLAFSRKRKELLFSGAEGLYVVGLKGERIASCCDTERASGRGGMFDPSGRGRAVLGGDGLYMWDFESRDLQRLARQGQYPVWAQDGGGIWYSQSSSDLLYYNLKRGETEPLLAVRRTHNAELSFARAVRQSPCGRYLALPLTGKRLKGVARGKVDPSVRERIYEIEHCFCVLDLERREIWRKSGYISNFGWIDAEELVSV